ncbi:mitochondrial carrier protein, putative [Leishmania tarentolae]|uniref:Mitochondrial carrier protein, putative n=1 Tax=Leishmania tarentolae TaxID=5689 RepID=A0A640KVV1_LEITA|nr:mitochondrial carrier protein, putative [Leishmania tarentolae]
MAVTPAAPPSSGGLPRDDHLILCRFLGGTVGGVMQAVSSHPFDTIKSRVQNGVFPSISSCVWNTWKDEGIRGFYRGATPQLLFCGFQNAVLFSLNQTMNNFMSLPRHDPHTSPSLWRTAVAAQLTAPLYVLIVVPVEKVKVQLQMLGKGSKGPSTVTGPVSCLLHIIQVEGYRGILSGYTPTLMSHLVGLPFYFLGCQTARAALLDTPLASTATGREVVVPMLSGVAAGVCFWTSNYPCDFVKTRVQASKMKVRISDIIRTTYAAGGLRAFYRGYTACLLRSFPANASVWLGIELTTTFLLDRRC